MAAAVERTGEGPLVPDNSLPRTPDARRRRAPRLEDDEQWREGRIPFRVRMSVSGHRDLAKPDELRAQVQTALDAIAGQFPETGTTRVCFTVLSSLTEGADRLVVEEAFARLGNDKVELHAVLPLSKNDYERDFETLESEQRFNELLAAATTVTQTAPTSDRDEAYERAGRWVVDHSDVLIALWDGHQASGRGGTAEIARYARCRGLPVIVVPTARATEPDREPRAVDWSGDLARGLKSAARAYARLEEFNKGSIGDAALRQRIEAQAALPSDAADGSAVHWQYERVAEWALPRLARADILAMKYQRRYYHAGGSLYWLAALAVTAVAAQAEAGLSDWFALVEVGFMVTLVVIYRLAHRVGFQERWIAYRSLAEAFRSALFIVMTGAQRRKESASGSLGMLEEPWFQRAFSEAWKDRPDPVPRSGNQQLSGNRKRPETADMRRFVIEAWINDQVEYHRTAVSRFRRGYRRLSNTILVLFGLTILIGILHSFRFVPGETWKRLFIFLAVALPAFGAALTGIRDQRQYRVHADRSNRTANRLSQLEHNIESQKSARSVQALAAQVQTVIEAETLDWSGVIEFQDLEMVF
jgi:hypothetical protein